MSSTLKLFAKFLENIIKVDWESEFDVEKVFEYFLSNVEFMRKCAESLLIIVEKKL